MRKALTVAGVLFTGSALPLPGQDVQIGRWSPAGELSVGRYAPAAALLPDGRVLVAGGYSFEANRTYRSTDLFDPEKGDGGEWSAGPELALDRNFPEAISLPGGDTLFLAGFRGRTGTTASTERVEGPATRIRAGEPLTVERELFSVTRLADGRFLLTGGYSTRQRKTLAGAEIYDPATDRFTETAGPLHHGRFGHTAVRLSDGKVLVVGGKVLATNDSVLPAELFDPATGQFTVTGSLSVGRDRCTAWPLSPGKEDRIAPSRILVAGGSAKEGGTTPARRCEIYDPATGQFTPGPELRTDRMAHTATPLPDGRTLLVGGWSTSENRTTPLAELWDPAAHRFLPAGTLQAGRHDHAAVLLKDGRVLIAGGKEAPARDDIQTPLRCELWSPK